MMLLLFGSVIIVSAFVQRKKVVEFNKDGIVYFNGKEKQEFLKMYVFEINRFNVELKNRPLYNLMARYTYEIIIFNKESIEKVSVIIPLGSISEIEVEKVKQYLVNSKLLLGN